MTHHPHPEDLLARLRREQDINALHLDGNRWRPERPPTARETARNLLVVFLVGAVLTCALLVLAGVEGR